MTAVSKIAVPPSYFRLVKAFPLIPIRDEAHLDAAIAVVDRLSGEELDDGGEDYLVVLSDLIEAYEADNHPIPDGSLSATLRLLMESIGLTADQVVEKTGITTARLSAVLLGKGRLTTEYAQALAELFHVSPAAFDLIG